MSEEEINEALKIIKEPITVNSIEYKYFNQENYEKLLSVYENAKWFVSNWEQVLQNIKDLQQKVEQLENIRKEAIKATKDVKQFVYDELVDRNVSGATETHCKIMDLLNILNKGSEE